MIINGYKSDINKWCTKKKKTLDIMNSSLKIFTTLLVISLCLIPFLSVFGKALYNDGQINLSEFLFLKDEFYLVKNSILSATITAILSTIFALALSLMTFFVSERQKKVIMFILLLTMVSPPFIGSLTYIELFGRNGFITRDILKTIHKSLWTLGNCFCTNLGIYILKCCTTHRIFRCPLIIP